MKVRSAVTGDLEELTALLVRLWPDAPAVEHRADVHAILTGQPRSTLPLVLFVAEDEAGRLIGFLEIGLRSHADGCDTTRPCAFVEGWYVDPQHQRHGIGRLLMERAEVWALEQGCTELASDTWLDNQESQRAHVALGFEVVDRCVNYRKALQTGVART